MLQPPAAVVCPATDRFPLGTRTACRLLGCLLVSWLCSSAATAAEPVAATPGVADQVRQGIANGQLAGAVVAAADGQQMRCLESFGHAQLVPERAAMSTESVFDLASITKPVATALSIALLVQQEKVAYRDPVARYLPEFRGDGKQHITVEQCLLHTSGLIPDNALSDYDEGAERAWQRICALALRTAPGERFAYSDVGFIVLGKLIEAVSGTPLDDFARRQIFEPLGMSETGFNPPAGLAARAAATEQRGGRWLRGRVHDPRAARLDGVAGHAGLFSTASDLVRLGRELLKASRGESTWMTAETFAKMTEPVEVGRGTRTRGWDHQSPYSRNRGTALSPAAFGHGGFTGTVLWIDPEQELIFVFLSSRLHPDGQGSVNGLAGQIVTRLARDW